LSSGWIEVVEGESLPVSRETAHMSGRLAAQLISMPTPESTSLDAPPPIGMRRMLFVSSEASRAPSGKEKK
jgi:hypothetical protein